MQKTRRKWHETKVFSFGSVCHTACLNEFDKRPLVARIISLKSLRHSSFLERYLGDPRSAPLVQFQLLHAKFHLCSPATRGLLMSTYVKFINLFPEVKTTIQDVLKVIEAAKHLLGSGPEGDEVL